MGQPLKIAFEEFPPLLREITDPPKCLYIEGEFPDPVENTYLAVVGPRKYTSYGKDVCEKLITGLKGYPIVIVSGLALGVDAIAHESALRTNLKTIAVPGSGLDRSVLYPKNNLALAEKILNAGGALLSEFEPTFRATPYSFPQRNRIVAGLSRAVLVIEAARKSGALITARLALEYNRDVFTVPQSIFSESSYGPHMLIKNGAVPITSAEDLVQALGFTAKDTFSRNLEELENCSGEERKILELLNEPMSKDVLLRKVALPTSAVHALLSMLEIKELIEESGGEIRRK